MSEMIDRVGLAIDEAMLDSRELPCGERQAFVARAAIKSMREPTGKMKDAGHYTYEQSSPWITGCSLDGQPSKAWRAMIDAAMMNEK